MTHPPRGNVNRTDFEPPNAKDGERALNEGFIRTLSRMFRLALLPRHRPEHAAVPVNLAPTPSLPVI